MSLWLSCTAMAEPAPGPVAAEKVSESAPGSGGRDAAGEGAQYGGHVDHVERLVLSAHPAGHLVRVRVRVRVMVRVRVSS